MSIYRDWVQSNDLVETEVLVKETDLSIKAEKDVFQEAVDSVRKFRTQIEDYIAKDPKFQSAYSAYKVNGGAPEIIKDMSGVSFIAGVGPFAAVAGAIAEYVGKELLRFSPQIIVENGGDIFIKSTRDRIVAIYAGSSIFNKKIALEIKASDTPMGICTSSGTIGHSSSFGEADAAVVLSGSALLADAAATRVCNTIKKKSDISHGIEIAKKIKGLKGVVIIKDNEIGIWGSVKICKI